MQGQVAFGFARLSIIDLAGGMQPMWNERRTVLSVCNGEIFNYRELREQLTLQERALALATDIFAAVAIGCGLAMAFSPANLFVVKPNVWLHIKLTAVVLMILPVHGILRGRIKRYGMGQITPVPTWLWSLLLGGVSIAIFCVTTKLHISND